MSAWSLFCHEGNAWCHWMSFCAPRHHITRTLSLDILQYTANTAHAEDIIPTPPLSHQECGEADPPLWLPKVHCDRGFTGSLQLDWTFPGMLLLAMCSKEESQCGSLPRKPPQTVKEMAHLPEVGEEGSLPTEGTLC